MPIGRRHVVHVLDRADVVEKARPAAIEDRLAVRDLPHHLDEIGDAIRAIGEDVREFARHGDGMHGSGWAEQVRILPPGQGRTCLPRRRGALR
jgi:hypothetical protein